MPSHFQALGDYFFYQSGHLKIYQEPDMVCTVFLGFDEEFKYMGKFKIKKIKIHLKHIGDKDHFGKFWLDDYLLILFGPRPFKKHHQMNPKSISSMQLLPEPEQEAN